MIVFDTDIVGILQGAETPLRLRLEARILSVDGLPMRISVVTFHEHFQGWVAALAAARDEPRLIHCYRKLAGFQHAYGRQELLPYDARASAEFRGLRSRGIRIGTMDLRIACIALVHQARVVTRNLRDFRQVPGLAAEDWTAEPDANGVPRPPVN